MSFRHLRSVKEIVHAMLLSHTWAFRWQISCVTHRPLFFFWTIECFFRNTIATSNGYSHGFPSIENRFPWMGLSIEDRRRSIESQPGSPFKQKIPVEKSRRFKLWNWWKLGFGRKEQRDQKIGVSLTQILRNQQPQSFKENMNKKQLRHGSWKGSNCFPTPKLLWIQWLWNTALFDVFAYPPQKTFEIRWLFGSLAKIKLCHQEISIWSAWQNSSSKIWKTLTIKLWNGEKFRFEVTRQNSKAQNLNHLLFFWKAQSLFWNHSLH